MSRRVVLLAAFFFTAATLSLGTAALAQSTTDTNSSVLSQNDSTGDSESKSFAEYSDRTVSVRKLVPNILHDQKPIWLFPFRVLQGKHLEPALIVAGATAVLIALDPHDEPYFRNSSGFNAYKTGPLRGRNTTMAITFFPAAIYVGGLFAKDSYAKDTGLFAAEAIADTQIVSLVMKAIDGRLHPSDIPAHGDFSHTWFKYPGGGFNPGSFPSNHAASAFATAAVFSRRYPHHHWVPWVAYGLATLTSFTRVPDQAHFPSDVFAGAAMGYAIGHFVVLPRRSE